MKTTLSNFTVKSKRRFLQVLALLVLVSVGILSQPALAQTTPQAPCTLADIDRDNDGLIEICDLEGLSAMRYQLDGSGYKASSSTVKITAGCAEGGCKGYELDKDLDFDDDASYSNVANKTTWIAGEGWNPIGYYHSNANNKPFEATFKGNGHTISDLMINRPTVNRIGLFGYTDGGTINNVDLSNVDITGKDSVGSLAGSIKDSNITNSYATGDVTGTGDSVGGLVGSGSGNITNSYAAGDVTSTGDSIGGLVGWKWGSGKIMNSHAEGSVKGSSGVGGLVGSSIDSNITNSYATNAVTGTRGYVGGLVGYNRDNNITDSYAMGVVIAGIWGYVGGLVGYNWDSSITNSYAMGYVKGGESWFAGGLVGYNLDSSITNSYATGYVNGYDEFYIGGLVGYNQGNITNSYATGSVEGKRDVGGLAGSNFGGSITNSYATGAVKGSLRRRGFIVELRARELGGLVGDDRDSSITNSYWDKTTSRMSSSSGGVGKTTTELQSPSTPGSTSTEIYYGWSTNDWDFGTNEQYPALKYRDGTLIPNQGREIPEEPVQIPQIEIAGVPTGAVNEGERITLTASSASSVSSIPLIYHWQQTSGKTLLTSPSSGSSVTLDVPEDYVGAGENIGNVVLMLEASNDVGSTTQQVSITIAKHNNGGIATLGAPSLNERELTASSIDISGDPDGSGNNIGYQWQSRQSTQTAWVNVPAAGTNERYTIPADTADTTGIVQYRVVVSYTDGQGYGEEVVSEAVIYERRVAPQPSIDIASLTSCGTADIDQDDDGLIEICNLEGLNAIRHQLDGSGYKVSASATKITTGCAESGCRGYELSKDLDFNDDDSYSSTSNKVIWTTGSGWEPIGVRNSGFEGAFDGNGYTISNLMVNRLTVHYIGLFGYTRAGARIVNVGLLNLDIVGRNNVGGLIGRNSGSVLDSYVAGSVKGSNNVGGLVGYSYRGGTITTSYATGNIEGNLWVGGLVGDNWSSITNSYAAGAVSGNRHVGGLVGWYSEGSITTSYATGSVSGNRWVGGLVGSRYSGTISSSYWDKTTSRISSSAGGVGKTTTELQSPMTATGIYSSWSISSWDFGTREQYPALKYSDGTLIPNQVRERLEEPPQMPQIEIAGVPTGAVNEGESITLTASSTSSASSVPLIYQWTQTSGKTLLTNPTSRSSVTLDVPEDYVVESANTSNVVLTLEANNNLIEQIAITITKSNNGGIAALGVPNLNERELTAPPIDLSGDPDGGGNNIRYQWQSKQSAQAAWVNVQMAGTNERYTIPADTAGIVQYRVVVSYTDGQGYEEEIESEASIYKGNTIPSVEIAGVPVGAVDEGEQITLTAFPRNSENNILPSYSWTQTLGKTLLTNPTSGSSVTLNVPEDYVVASENIGNVVLMLEASNDVGSTAQQVSITIAKRNDGGISTLGVPTLNERELTAPSIDLSGDLDGGGSNIRYQWQSRQSTQMAWVNVPVAGTNERYTIPAATAGIVQYRVVVSYTDGQGYGEEVVSAAVIYETGIELADLTSCGTADIDQDDDGLIEICDLEGLNAIRHQLDGSGYRVSGSATKITAGCAEGGCKGYELDEDLDFDSDASYSNVANKVTWTTGSGWQPIGYYEASNRTNNKPFTATFEGNNHIISNLMVDRSNTNNVGLFSFIERGTINNVGLSNINIKGNRHVSGLVSRIWQGTITNSYVTGNVTGGHRVGGLVGENWDSSITNSYATGNVVGGSDVGGLVSHNSGGRVMNSYATSSVSGDDHVGGLAGNHYGGTIRNSYATGDVVGINLVGGLVGNNWKGPIMNSYWDKTTSGMSSSRGGVGKTTEELQSPTTSGSTSTEIYYGWSTNSWDFGTSVQYPALKYSDGTLMPNQVRELPEEPAQVDIASPIVCSTADIDQDNDGLIEICDLEGLNAVRHQLDGSGYRVNGSATKITAGCARGGCKGYELSKDLDFDDDASYSNVANKVTWTTGSGWQPIGTSSNPFNATFRANKHSISNLMIARSSLDQVGLFKKTGNQARIEGVSLIDVDIQGSWGVGGLVGLNNGGRITSSYITGIVRGGSSIGGLVGDNYGPITNSYTNVEMSGDSWVGGIVGCNFSGGIVTNSYTVPRINRSSSSSGGLLGANSGSRSINSYWDKEVSGISSGDYGVGLTTAELQSPITSTGIYSRWSTNAWDFGSNEQYPALKYRDGTLMPNQGREIPEEQPQIEIAGVPAGAVDEGERITLTASSTSSASSIPLIYHWMQTSGKTLLTSPTSGSSVTLNVPEDYVVASENIGNVVLILEAINDVGSTTQQIAITITKRNNGGIAALGVPSLNERELTAPSIDISGDPDGSGNNIRYQWQSRQSTQAAWVNVQPAGTNERYTIPADITGIVEYRVVVSYTDGQGYGEEVLSGAVIYERRVAPQPSIEIASLTSCGTADIDQDDDGLIEICNLEGLNAIRHQLDGSGYKVSAAATKITAGCAEDGCKGYELDEDLDFDSDASYSSTPNKVIWTTGSGWQPIGYYEASNRTNNKPFTATFEGNNHIISNLMVDRSNTNNVGLFGFIERGTINNVGLSNINIKGNRYVSGLVSRIWYGTITNSYVMGNVSGGYRVGGLVGEDWNSSITNSYATGNVVGGSDVGGLVGKIFGGSHITNSYATGSVSGDDHVGGLVGENYRGTIRNSYATGNVTGDHRVGGLVGHNFYGTIRNSYATGSVSGDSRVGGLVGYKREGTIGNSYATGSVSGGYRVGGLVGFFSRGTIRSSYWDKTTSGMSSSDGGVGKTTEELQSPTTSTGIYSSWSTNDWDFGTREQYPALKYSDGTLMPNQVRELPEEPAQVDIASLTSCGTADIDQDDDGLIEICDLEGLNAIRHQLDGGGYKVSASATKITAGCAEGGCKGYELDEDLDFDSDASYSNVANKVTWTTGSGWQPIGYYEASNRTNNKPFTATFEGNNHIISNLMVDRSNTNNVGLFGFIERGTINNVGLSNINIKGNRHVSGLVSRIWHGTITNSYVTGNVTGGHRVGGLVGENWDSSITNSYATGNVVGGSDVGGLVSHNSNGRVMNSYAMSDVAGNSNVGGLAGNHYGGTIRNSYATGDVVGINLVGGLVGNNWKGPIMNSYWDKTTSGMSSSRGGVGKTTEELQSPTTSGSTSTEIYYGWSTNSWDFGTQRTIPCA